MCVCVCVGARAHALCRRTVITGDHPSSPNYWKRSSSLNRRPTRILTDFTNQRNLRTRHSMETVLAIVRNDLLCTMDKHGVTILIPARSECSTRYCWSCPSRAVCCKYRGQQQSDTEIKHVLCIHRQIWNTLSLHIRQSDSNSCFKLVAVYLCGFTTYLFVLFCFCFLNFIIYLVLVNLCINEKVHFFVVIITIIILDVSFVLHQA